MNHIRTLGGVAVVLFAACAGPPPATIGVSTDLPEGIQVAAARARDAWCAAPVGWCPDIVSEGGEAHIEIHHFADERKGCQMRNDGLGTIDVRPAIADWSADDLTGAMTHEFGHFGIDGHVPSSALMHARFSSPGEIPWAVDTEASDAWCAQQGC